jgi:hypothetical protein
MTPMLVIIESPFGTRPDGSRATPAEMEENVLYARRALADSLAKGEAPYASHLLYPQALHDADAAQRRQGMEAGFAWGEKADLCAVYIDRGVTPGMKEGIDRALARCTVIVYRTIGKHP